VVDLEDTEDAEDAEDVVHTVDMVEAVEPERAMKVSAPIAKLTDILQVHARSGNAPWMKEETEETTEETTSTFTSSAGSQDLSKLIGS